VQIGITIDQYHVNGNQFILLHEQSTQWLPTTEKLQRLAQQINYDQLIWLTEFSTRTYSGTCRIFNRDGSTAPLCPTGINALSTQLFQLHPNTNTIQMRCADNQLVAERQANQVRLIVDICRSRITSHHKPDGHLIYVGNWHLIFSINQWQQQQFVALAQSLQKQPDFIDGINVSAVYSTATHQYQQYIYERGVGLTASCGSAAAALAVRHYKQNRYDKTITIEHPGGLIHIERLNQQQLAISAQAVFCYQGTLPVNCT